MNNIAAEIYTSAIGAAMAIIANWFIKRVYTAVWIFRHTHKIKLPLVKTKMEFALKHNFGAIVTINLMATDVVNPLEFYAYQGSAKSWDLNPSDFPYNQTFTLSERTGNKTVAVIEGGGPNETGHVCIRFIKGA